MLFALVVTQSVQIVGIYLAFASLNVPALAGRRFAPHLGLWIGYGVGLAGHVLGLISSSLFDWPTAAVIVVTLILAFDVAIIISQIVPQRLRAMPDE